MRTVKGENVESTDPVETVSAEADGRSWSSQQRLDNPGRRSAWERQLRRVARSGLVRLSQPTYRARMLPDFLIVGAQRCGTTSMFGVLSQHPAVFSSVHNKKELRFFDDEYARGLSWYQSHFPVRARARATSRGTGIEPVAFEGSPYYMFHPLAPERIARALPEVRLIVMVRDPVERAYSQHAHQVIRGLETESFERALELEDSRIDGEAERMASDPSYVSRPHRLYTYRTRGQYAEQLEHLESLFGRDRIHVVDCGDFFADPGPDYDRVLKFLGLPALGEPEFMPRNARPRSPIPQSLQAALDEHFLPYDERLAPWLERTPSWRR